MGKGIEFCIRMKEDWWLSVKEFMESGEKERIVSYKLPQKDKKLLKDYPEMVDKVIKCRLMLPESKYAIKSANRNALKKEAINA